MLEFQATAGADAPRRSDVRFAFARGDGLPLYLLVALHRARRALRVFLRNTRRMSTLAVAAGGLVAAVSSANAAECVNGYMERNGLVFACQGSPFGGSQALRGSPSPEITGSISSPAPAAATTGPMMVEGPQDCRPGAYWMMTRKTVGNVDPTTPVACR